MSRACARCGSSSIVLDSEMLPGVPGWHRYEKCLMCGCREFVEKEVKKEAKVMAKSGQCKFEGCDKRILAGGYCYRHYKAVHGHKYEGGKIHHEAGNIRMPEKEPRQGKIKAHPDSVLPLIRIFLDPELLDKLTKRAKVEYRNVEQQAAFMLAKELGK